MLEVLQKSILRVSEINRNGHVLDDVIFEWVEPYMFKNIELNQFYNVCMPASL